MSQAGEIQENFVTRRIMAPNFKLNNGHTIPILGLGTWKSRNYDCFTAVSQAIDIGYRHIDTAFVYQNEVEVGKAINQKIKDEEVTREELFICTKLANIHHDPTVVEYACRQSLNNLKLKYIDLYLIHFPVGETYQEIEDISGKLDLTDTDYVKTWAAMEALVEKGLVKSIGVSNFNSEQITRILKHCTIRPVVNQVECHPGFNQKELIKFCKRHSIHVVAYCPLGRPDPERKWPNYMYDHTIRKLAQKYEKTPAQMCLRYVIQLGAWPIPKTVKHERLIENFQVFDFIISPEDMEIMDGYNRNRRLIPFTPMKSHMHYPFNIPY